MSVTLQEIHYKQYFSEKELILALARKIWTRPVSFQKVAFSLERWSTNQEAGLYFYILQDDEKIGLTGYWPVTNSPGSFCLRHHGTIKKGTGRLALDSLVSYLQAKYDGSCKKLVELIPEGREELIETFQKWGFDLDTKGVPDWEPQKDYFKYAMVKYL